MKKSDFVALVAENVACSKKDTEKMIDAIFAAMGDVLVQGDKLQIGGFGTFGVSERAARTGYNPRTRKPIQIPASKVPVFRASSALKDKLNGKK